MALRDARGFMQERRVSEYRTAAIRVGLAISWALLAILTAAAIERGSMDDPEVWPALAATTVGLIVLTLAPWQRIVYRTIGDVYIVLWTLLMVAGIFVVGSIRVGEPLLGAYLLVVAFGGVTARTPATLVAIGTVGAGGYVIDLVRTDVGVSLGEAAVGVGLIVMMAVLAASATLRLVRTAQVANVSLEELARQEANLRAEERHLSHLYAVAASMAAGSKMSDVVPELGRRIAEAMSSNVALLLLYRPDAQHLEVLSPLWVAGQPLRAEGRQVSLAEPGLLQRVFVDGGATLAADTAVIAQEPVLADLGVHSAIVAALRLEAEVIGAVVVADKEPGPFTMEDVARLEAIAVPATLIIDHVSRYEQAWALGEEMAEVARMKSDFVSVVSHELRTPLTSIIGALATLGRPQLAPTDPNARELLASARRQADRLRGLIEDLLVVSRLDNRAVPLHFEPVDVGVLVREVVRQVPGTDGLVRVDMSPTLPTVNTDPTHLERIITNLLSNSIRYAPGSPIEVVGRLHGGEVQISVVDHGPGIPYELHDHIFDRFTQVAAAEIRSRGGTGLGLSIVRGLTEAMGGRVWFEPTVGGGATFVVALPHSAG